MFAMPNNRVAHIAGEIKYAFVLIVVLNSLNLRLGDRELVVIALSPLPAECGKGGGQVKRLISIAAVGLILKWRRNCW
jgi:hypothetical protein